MLLFMRHVRRREAAGTDPLVSPALFANRQMTGGLLMFFFQFLVMMGLFFAIPLYLSVALGPLGDRHRPEAPAAVGHDAARGRRRAEVLPDGVAAAGGEHRARRRSSSAIVVAVRRDGRGGDRRDRDAGRSC